MNLSQDLNSMLTNTKDLARQFDAAKMFLERGANLEEISQFFKNQFSERETKIKARYNDIIQYYPDIILKFREYLNAFEKIKMEFLEDVDDLDLSLEKLSGYTQAFLKLAEGFKKNFEAELISH